MASKILVMNMGGMGDLLLSVPALRALRHLYPGAQVTLLTVERSAEVARELPGIDRVCAIPFRTSVYRGANFLLSLPEFLATLGYFLRLRKERFDLMINFRTLDSWASALKTALVFALVGAKERAGRDTEGRGFFYTRRRFEPFAGEKPEAAYDLDVVAALGGAAAGAAVELSINAGAAASVERLLAEKGVGKADRVILVSPGAPWPSKRWPAERFAAVMRALAAQGRKMLVLGSREEKILCAEIAATAGAVDMAGLLDFGMLAALLARSHLLITNDTGVMHLAAAVKCPMVALIGPGDTARYSPGGDPAKTRALHHPQDCSPCFKYDCATKKCLTAITAGEAAAAAEQLLARTKQIGGSP